MKKILKRLLVLVLVLPFAFLFTACGSDGLSAYEIAVKNGFQGTEIEWLESLKGADGQAGANGTNGANGADGTSSIGSYEMYEEAKKQGYAKSYVEWMQENFDIVVDAESYAVNKNLLSVAIVKCCTSEENMKQNNSEKQGSAVLYKFDEAGNAYYITNYHVAYYSSSATKKAYPYFRLELYGHDKAFHYMPAQFVGGSNSYDIAVLKVDAEKYISTTNAKPVTICKDVSPAGTAVVAIGNTNSEGINISKGIIDIESEYFTLTSAMEISTTQRLIQHDAYIAGGNSGGGLFNMNGELVGITNGGVQTNERKNYAIPASVAKGVADKLISAYEADNSSYELSVCDLKITNFRYDTISSFNETTNVVETIDKFRVSAIDESSVFFGKLIANGVNSDRYISAKINDKEIDFSREYMFNELTLTLKVGDKLTFVVQRMGETDPVEVSATIIAEMFVSVL